MKHSLLHKRDFYAGGMMMLLGSIAAFKGPDYRMGNLMHMGPGFLPTALGIILIILGIVIAGTAAVTHTANPEEERILPEHPEWFAWLLILLGPVGFIVFGKFFGMIPGTFACVFISALGDRTATWKSSFVLACVVTLFGVLLFHNVLKIPMPILHWM